MINWIKALFMKDEPEINPDDFIAFTDVFDEAFLSQVYALFEKHINDHTCDKYFSEKLKSELLFGNQWDNLRKIFNNLKISSDIEGACNFLERNCYNVWFARKHLAGGEFTYAEKSAFAGFLLFQQNEFDDDYPYVCIDQEIKDQRTLCSEQFINIVFSINIVNFAEDYNKFYAREVLA